MLGEGNYSQEYVDDCRKKVAAQVAAYRKLARAAGPSKALEDFADLLSYIVTAIIHHVRNILDQQRERLKFLNIVQIS